MLAVSREEIDAAADIVDVGVLGRLPGDLRETVGEFRALVAIGDLCTLNALDRLTELKGWCLSHHVNWEQFCDELMPKGRRTIDHYLTTRQTFGDGSYEGVVKLTTKAERAAAYRLLKNGTIRHDGDCIVIERKRIQNDAAHAHEIVTILREAIAQRDASKAEAAQEKALRKREAEAAEKDKQALRDAADAKDRRIAHLEARPIPKDLTTELDRKWWPFLQQIRVEWICRKGQMAAMIDEDEHSRAFWAALHGILAEIQEGVYTLAMELLGARGNDYEAIVNLERGAPVQLGANPAWTMPETPPEMIERLRGNGHDTTESHPAA